MIDSTTHQPLSVTVYGDGPAEIMLPFEQLDKVTALLDAHGVSYWVDEETLSIDGGPEVIWINLSQRTDPATVQRLLDSIP